MGEASRRKKAKAKKQRPSTSKLETHKVQQTKATVEHKPFKLSKAVVLDTTGLPSSWTLLWSTIKDTYTYRWRTFFFILSYGLFWYGLTFSDTGSTTSALYGSVFGIIASLASIWMIRHREAGEEVTIRFAYYRGMVQLIPFFLVLAVLSLQLIPAGVGFFIFEISTTSGFVVTALEQSVPILIWVFGGILSLYWLTATLMALYVVTIPGTLPMDALAAGKKLVDGRRWFIQRRLLIGIAVVGGLYALLAYWFASAEWTNALEQLTIIFPMAVIPVTHTYLYKLYNSLIK